MFQQSEETQRDLEIPPLLPDASSTSRLNGNAPPSISDVPAPESVSRASLPPQESSPLHITSTYEPAPSSPARLRRIPSAHAIRNGEGPATPILHKRASLNSLNSARGATSPRSPIPRRSSSNLFSSTAIAPMMSPSTDLTPAAEEPTETAIMTAAAVAEEYFQKELSAHDAPPGKEPEVAVILHDACYGHRFSRPRTSKAGLSTIVERPERLLATVLGISAAYVRLGGRHVGARHPPRPKLDPSSVPPVPFRIAKSSRSVSLLAPAVTQVHGTKWMAELKMMCEGAEAKLAANGKELLRPNMQSIAEDGSDRPRLHEGDLYLCSESLEALEGALGGVCEAVDLVFANAGPSRAFVSVRPPGHHCSDTYPSGFCWINNVHVGISHAAIAHGLTHAAIIDFDLHHGDGSQSITWAHNARAATLPKSAPSSKKTSIGYFSIHDINSYPCEWGDEEKVRNASLCLENAHGQSIWNVHLQPWRTDEEFWELYQRRYLVLIEKTRIYLQQRAERIRGLPSMKPKAAIFISAGFDASEWESQGMQRHKVNVPTSFYARLTQEIVRLAQEEGLDVDGRVISVLEGGYSDRALMSGVFSHISGLSSSEGEVAAEFCGNGLGFEMRRLNLDSKAASTAPEPRSQSSSAYDIRWWSSTNLAELETCVNPPVIKETAPKKPRGPVNPTYSSPTQSFSAKIVSPSLSRKSTSGTTSRQPSLAGSIRPITPPPPDVDWATASHELSKLLVPSDRQTMSHKPEDLNAEATRVRRRRQSEVESLPRPQASLEDGKKMHLRERRMKTPAEKTERVEKQEPAAVSKATRRRTIAGATILKDEPVMPEVVESGPPSNRFRRRSSVASISSTVPRGASTEPVSIPASSNGTELPARSRRDSSNSTHKSTPSLASQVDTLPMKKTRPSGTSKRPPPSIPKRVTSRPLLPKEGSEKDPASMVLDEQPLNQPATIDSLSSGITRMSIKLHVPTKEEHIQREAKKKIAGKATAPKVPKAPKAPKASKAPGILSKSKAGDEKPFAKADLKSGPEVSQQSMTSASHGNQVAPASDTVLDPAAKHPVQPAAFAAPVNDTIPAPVAAPASASFSAPAPAPASAPAQVPPPFPAPIPPLPLIAEIVSPPEAELPIYPDAGAIIAPTPKTIDEAHNAHPRNGQGHGPSTPKFDKHGLPRFTSTSPIVFAPHNSNGKPKAELDSRAQDSPPSTDPVADIFRQQQQHAHHHHQTGIFPPPAAATTAAKNRPLQAVEGGNIWEVPDTPERQGT